MALSLTRFEIVLPNVDTGSAADNAIESFILNMTGLCDLVMYTAYIYPKSGNGTFIQQNVLYGLITTAQQATALGFLNTLNTALGRTVLCTINPVTSEP